MLDLGVRLAILLTRFAVYLLEKIVDKGHHINGVKIVKIEELKLRLEVVVAINCNDITKISLKGLNYAKRYIDRQGQS